MNTEQAKHLSIPDLLEKLGFQPVKETKGGREFWYVSPFREEKAPSFHTSLGRTGIWIWKDFGDIGGNVLDFVMRYKNYSQIREALAFLDEIYQPNLFTSATPQPKPTPPPSFSFHQQDHREAVENISESSILVYLDSHPIDSQAILNYLTRERHIPVGLIHRYLKEVHYRNTATGKAYFAFGMLNQSGGYEIRVASSRYSFKSALKARDISIVSGADPARGEVCIFEGMLDFLSLLAMQGREHLDGDAIIMHSLSSYRRAADAVEAGGYGCVKTYLDNNRPGQEGTARFKAEFGARVFPQSDNFAPHTDLNDALRASLGKKI